MMVFAKARLVLLSVPKTGTTALQEALGAQADLVVRDPPLLKHAPLFRYNRFFRPMLEKFVSEELDIVAVMREPVSWLGSWYRYRQRPFTEGKPNSTIGMSFDAFVAAYLETDQPVFANVGSQGKFLEPTKNGTRVTHLFRYEDQAAFMSFMQERLEREVVTGRSNVSPPGEISLDPQLKEALRRDYARDFDLWEQIGENGSYVPVGRPA